MSATVLIHAGRRSDGSPVREEVQVEPVGSRRYRLRQSPGLALGLAAGDVFELGVNDEYTVVLRGGNLCVQIFFEEKQVSVQALEAEASRQLTKVAGKLDGRSINELVFTVPLANGFAAIEEILNRVVSWFPGAEWHYGNVYDSTDGVTPLNWWLDGV